jgi:hypothetical protein
MQVTLTFDASDPDERQQSLRAQLVDDIALAVLSYLEWMRRRHKHGDFPPEIQVVYSEAKQQLYAELADRGIDLDVLMP